MNHYKYLFNVFSPFVLGVVSSDFNLEQVVVRHERCQTSGALAATSADT